MANTTALNQILAVEKGAKSRAENAITAVYHALQRSGGLGGLERHYRPKDDEDTDRLPSESTKVTTKVMQDVLPSFQEDYARYLDVVATKDHTNTLARADVVVDGTVILKDVPVSTLLFLEKQALVFKALVDKLPVFDVATNWTWDSNVGLWKSDVVTTIRTKKVPRNWVKAEATDKHPAQVEIFHEDNLVGYWDKTEFSGAVSPEEKRRLQERVAKFAEAVQVAREQANATTVVDKKIGETVLGHLFG